MTLQERLRQEAALIQYGERACVPGMLHEAAAELDRLQRENAILRDWARPSAEVEAALNRAACGFIGAP